MKKIDLNRLEGRQIAIDNEPEIPYADIEMIALKVNEIIDLLDGLTFEKKGELNACECKCHIGQVYVGCSDCQKKHYLGEVSEQRPFSVDNPPKEGERYWTINQTLGYLTVGYIPYTKTATYDKGTVAQNNLFRTKEEAEAALSRVLQALKS